MRRSLLFVVSMLLAVPAWGQVRLITDEAEAVLAILEKRAKKEPVGDADWRRLFGSEGYRRLQERELSMKRAFEEEAFREFAMSDALLTRLPELRRTFEEWRRADLSGSAKLALAYLPPGTPIKAKVYAVIKPKSNSFVFDLGGDPAIFVYLEALPREVFEGIVAHEFHHVGYAAACSSAEELPPHQRDLRRWLSAFGEGVATVAAAGGPGRTPSLKPDALAEWQTQMQRVPDHFETVQRFLTGVVRGELDADVQQTRGMELFGFVGPWYTVGGHVVTVIEEELGRDALLAAFCDQRTLLGTYNRAARKRMTRTGGTLPLWSDELVNAFAAPTAPAPRSAPPPPQS